MCVRTVLVNLKRHPQVVKAKISHELIIYILYIGQAVDLALSAIARITASWTDAPFSAGIADHTSFFRYARGRCRRSSLWDFFLCLLMIILSTMQFLLKYFCLLDVCILLLVFNAAQRCPQILSLFETYTKRHFCYLRDTIPSFIPSLKVWKTFVT